MGISGGGVSGDVVGCALFLLGRGAYDGVGHCLLFVQSACEIVDVLLHFTDCLDDIVIADGVVRGRHRGDDGRCGGDVHLVCLTFQGVWVSVEDRAGGGGVWRASVVGALLVGVARALGCVSRACGGLGEEVFVCVVSVGIAGGVTVRVVFWVV